MPQNNNPLSRFFRQPAIYLRLPSSGSHWPDGSLDMPDNKELPVFPMTAVDEIAYRTPDALFNGEAVVSVIQSCIPNIKDAWKIPAVDIDSILIAIRIASFGHEMPISTACPGCNEENEYNLDLRTVLDKLRSPDYSAHLQHGDITVTYRPLNYREMSDSNLIQFEQQKTLQVLADTTVSAESKAQQLNQMMKRITKVTIRAMAQSISEIQAGDAVTSDVNYIEEFLQNCDRKIFNKIKDEIMALREQAELKPLKIKCPSCQNEYEQVFTMDMARFFDSAS